MRCLLLLVACCVLTVGCGAPAVAASATSSSTTTPDSKAKSVSGRLPPAVIQKIVRENFPNYRHCYEDGLRRDLTLSGKIMVRFVIARDGSVRDVWQGDGSTMLDPEVTRCVVEAFKPLHFPAPEGGIVTVVYPIMFTQGNDRHREGDCLIESKTEETMVMTTTACPMLTLMDTLMKTEEGVTEAFASRHLAGFEQNASGTRARPTIAGRETWTSTIAAGGGKPFRKLLIVQYKPGWAEFVSCQDDLARESSTRCDQSIEEFVQRTPQAKK